MLIKELTRVVWHFTGKISVFWIKIAIANQANGWHKTQNFFARLFACPMLRPTLSAPGQKGLDEEVRRLKRVREREVLVPEVVTRRPGWVLLEDIGQSLFQTLEQEKEQNRRTELLVHAAQSLAQLHQLKGWHGTGQLRDFVCGADNKIGFIDFEENVGDVMSLDDAQARDFYPLYDFGCQV